MRIRKLRIPDETVNLLRTLHPDIKRKITAALQSILNDPYSGKFLKDQLDGLQSFRVGKLSIAYRTLSDKGIIEVIAIGPRKVIYEETLRLLQREKQ